MVENGNGVEGRYALVCGGVVVVKAEGKAGYYSSLPIAIMTPWKRQLQRRKGSRRWLGIGVCVASPSKADVLRIEAAG